MYQSSMEVCVRQMEREIADTINAVKRLTLMKKAAMFQVCWGHVICKLEAIHANFKDWVRSNNIYLRKIGFQHCDVETSRYGAGATKDT